MTGPGAIELPPERSLPPGQHLLAQAPIMHYGPVPRPRPEQWRFTIGGATHDGVEHVLTMEQLMALPTLDVVADLHCSTRWSTLDEAWTGVAARDVLAAVPPAAGAQDVVVFAEYGYAANIRVEDLASGRAVLATHHDGRPLSEERGGPMRLILPHLYSWKGPKWVRGWNYVTEPEQERGFWEARGYHLRGDAWREERYSYQE